MNGLVLFCKYAFPPNRLQYCGPEESKTLFELLIYGDHPNELKNLALHFEGAIPYFKLIAQANKIKDFLDERVVEAYWLGNDLLKNIKIGQLHQHIEERFRKKTKIKEWRWLELQPVKGAKPFHGFHVFDIYRQIGLIRSGGKDKVLDTMDKCRIGWGKIKNINLKNNPKEFSFGNAIVEYFPLKFNNLGKLQLGEKTLKSFYLIDTLLKENDDVSLHWDFICDKLTPRQKQNLIYWTNYHLNLTNKII
jgi:hypothetical protein